LNVCILVSPCFLIILYALSVSIVILKILRFHPTLFCNRVYFFVTPRLLWLFLCVLVCYTSWNKLKLEVWCLGDIVFRVKFWQLLLNINRLRSIPFNFMFRIADNDTRIDLLHSSLLESCVFDSDIAFVIWGCGRSYMMRLEVEVKYEQVTRCQAAICWYFDLV